MKFYIQLFLSILFITTSVFSSCSPKKRLVEDNQEIIASYIYNRLFEEKKNVLYINISALEKHSISSAIRGVQNRSSGKSRFREPEKNKESWIYYITPELKEHFLDSINTNYYYKQATNDLLWSESNIKSDKVILFDFEKEKNVGNKKLLNKGYLLKTISYPLISKDKKFALIIEFSERNGRMIFVFKKIKGQWKYYDAIGTTLI